MKFEIKQLITDLYNSQFFTGGAGALASVIFHSEKAGFWKRFGNIVIGCLVAGYVSPAIIDWMGIEKQSVINSMTFLIGAVGVFIIGGLITFGKAFKENPAQALKDLRNIWKKH